MNFFRLRIDTQTVLRGQFLLPGFDDGSSVPWFVTEGPRLE